MLSLLSVGSANGSNQARLRSSPKVAPTLDPLPAEAGGSPTWSITPSWCVAESVLPGRLGRPDDRQSPMSPTPSLLPPPGGIHARKSPASQPPIAVEPPRHPEDGHEVGGDG